MSPEPPAMDVGRANEPRTLPAMNVGRGPVHTSPASRMEDVEPQHLWPGGPGPYLV